MKNKKIIILIISIIVVLIIILGVFCLFNSIKKDKIKTTNNINNINTYYADFSNNMDEYNIKRNNFLNYVNDFVYYEKLDSNYNEVVSLLKEYDLVISKIDNNHNNLSKLCLIKYADTNINNKCSNYKKLYEEGLIIYKNDIESFNIIVNNYNKLITDKNNILSEYKSVYIK